MSSAVTCKLNDAFTAALAGTRFEYLPLHEYTKKGGWKGSIRVEENVLRDKKSKDTYISLAGSRGSLSCCGLSELICIELQKYYVEHTLNDKDWQELVAKYVKHAIMSQDKRIVIIGIPVKVGMNSLYNITFYDRLRETLEDFGFKQVGVKYKNNNSHNTIVAMVGQLP